LVAVFAKPRPRLGVCESQRRITIVAEHNFESVAKGICELAAPAELAAAFTDATIRFGSQLGTVLIRAECLNFKSSVSYFGRVWNRGRTRTKTGSSVLIRVFLAKPRPNGFDARSQVIEAVVTKNHVEHAAKAQWINQSGHTYLTTMPAFASIAHAQTITNASFEATAAL
jgi:hypothetical protein